MPAAPKVPATVFKILTLSEWGSFARQSCHYSHTRRIHACANWSQVTAVLDRKYRHQAVMVAELEVAKTSGWRMRRARDGRFYPNLHEEPLSFCSLVGCKSINGGAI